MAGNNLSLAFEMLMENNNDEYSVELSQIPELYIRNILMIFFQSPFWASLKNRLRMMAPRQAFTWVQRKIIKHFPPVLVLETSFSLSVGTYGKYTRY